MSKVGIHILSHDIDVLMPYRLHWVQAHPTGSKHYNGQIVQTFTVELPTGEPMQETGKLRFGDAPTVDRPKLSDLILSGALLHPQGFGYMWQRIRTTEIVCTCALGAAAEAIGSTVTVSSAIDDLFKVLGWSKADEPRIPYPEDVELCEFDRPEDNRGGKTIRIFGAVASLNDCARWSREQIAAYLKQFGF